VSVEGEAEIYRKPDVRRLLQSLRDGMICEIKPTFISDGFAYVDVEKVTGSPRRRVREILEKLGEVGVLLHELVETRVACPSCGSAKLSIKPICPSCGSPKLVRGEAIEHLACGHLDFEENFAGSKGMICPKCRKPLKALGVDYRRPGAFYKCLSCGELFGVPKKIFVCEGCHREFEEEEAVVINAYIYRLNPDKRDVILRETMDLKPLIRRLEKIGWTGVSSAFLRGKSGLVHSFSLLASTKNDGVSEPYIIVQIFVDERPVMEDPVLSLFAKSLDVGIKDVVLGVIPKLTPSARKLAEFYGFSIAEASNPKELIDPLWQRLKETVRKKCRTEAEA